MVYQERYATERRADEITHQTSPDDVVLNIAQLRSAEILREVLPACPERYPGKTREEIVTEAMKTRANLQAEAERKKAEAELKKAEAERKKAEAERKKAETRRKKEDAAKRKALQQNTRRGKGQAPTAAPQAPLPPGDGECTSRFTGISQCRRPRRGGNRSSRTCQFRPPRFEPCAWRPQAQTPAPDGHSLSSYHIVICTLPPNFERLAVLFTS